MVFGNFLVTIVVMGTLGNTFFLFLGLINIFMGSLDSIPLHGLELISFLTIIDNRCCHDNSFSVSWT